MKLNELRGTVGVSIGRMAIRLHWGLSSAIPS